ncbi:undecaprenyl-diphosphate phosphatase, partial [bacterium]|nr:undecaprenyl-diphosphate phosphatase [bacterium]
MFLNYLILGFVQGLTEFLPVSSSGHLFLFEKQLLSGIDENTLLLMNICFHMGTLIAVILFFRKFLYEYLIETLAFLKNPKEKLNQIQREVLYIVVLSIPTAIIGLGLKKSGIEHISSEAILIALTLTGVLCVIIDRLKDGQEKLSFKKAIVLGIVQGIAVIPGISRSGSTILAGLALGLSREKMASFSFLMSIPAIGGAFLLEMKDVFYVGFGGIDIMSLALGTFVAFVSGYLSLILLIGLLKKKSFTVFGVYCLLVSVTMFLRGV